jgi:N-acetylglutamate synthase-like GNAT family acetyltransferase
MEEIIIEPLEKSDKNWIMEILEKRWGSTEIVTRGRITNALNLPGLKAIVNDKNIGLITYSIKGNECEIVTLDSLEKSKGVGNKLLEAVIKLAKDDHLNRIWLITTNDNLYAQKFYHKRGFIQKAIYPNALGESRKLKPEIPIIGINGIPLKDEIELEIEFDR